MESSEIEVYRIPMAMKNKWEWWHIIFFRVIIGNDLTSVRLLVEAFEKQRRII